MLKGDMITYVTEQKFDEVVITGFVRKIARPICITAEIMFINNPPAPSEIFDVDCSNITFFSCFVTDIKDGGLCSICADRYEFDPMYLCWLKLKFGTHPNLSANR